MLWILRALVVAQIACATLVGVLVRNAIPTPGIDELSSSAYTALCLALILVGPGAVLPVLLLVRAGRLPPWKKRVVAFIEAALVFAYFVAAIPAVQ